MSSLINTVCRNRRLRLITLSAAVVPWAVGAGYSQNVELHAPSAAVAGAAASIGTTGSGSATFYLQGPSVSAKRKVQLGQDISLTSRELQSAGRYIAVVCSDSCINTTFFVSPAKPSSIAFLVHPSRAPVARNDVISGVALPFDEFHNLVIEPVPIQFQLAFRTGAPTSHSSPTHDGIAWFRTSSGKSAGPVQVTASINEIVAKRVVQQVASDACRLRIKGQRTAKGIVVETEPVRDCSGNPVPDGTIVTFTAKSGNEISFVDAPVKQDVARATMAAKGPVVLSAASGVAMGNEIRIGD